MGQNRGRKRIWRIFGVTSDCEYFVRVCYSDFCMTEFTMAYHHHVVSRRRPNKRLIVLMMLDSPNDLHTNETEALRQYLRQYTYINYPADDWLNKLLYALPLHGLLQQVQHNDDRTVDDVLLVPEH